MNRFKHSAETERQITSRECCHVEIPLVFPKIQISSKPLVNTSLINKLKWALETLSLLIYCHKRRLKAFIETPRRRMLLLISRLCLTPDTSAAMMDHNGAVSENHFGRIHQIHTENTLFVSALSLHLNPQEKKKLCVLALIYGLNIVCVERSGVR